MGVLINGNRGHGLQFFLRELILSPPPNPSPPPAIRLHRVTSTNAGYVFEELSIYI